MAPAFTARNPDQSIVGTMFLVIRTIEPNHLRVSFEQRRMSQEPYVLDEARQHAVLRAIEEHCAYRNWLLLAVHVRSNHVHVVLDAPVAPEKVMNEFKVYASRMLNQSGFESHEQRRWARHGSTRYLWSREQVDAAIAYVIDGQGDTMSALVNDHRW